MNVREKENRASSVYLNTDKRLEALRFNSKISLIGAGNIGGTLAHLLVLKNISNIVLFDIAEETAQGKALDLSICASIEGATISVLGTNDYSNIANSEVIVVAAGFSRKPGMSRNDLLFTNTRIIKHIAENIKEHSPKAFVIVVTNPLDAMTQILYETSGLPTNMVVGMSGGLDTGRFNYFLSKELNVPVSELNSLVLGGHNDDMVPLIKHTFVNGTSIDKLISQGKISEKRVQNAIQRTRKAGDDIVTLLKTGSAFYSPASAILDIIESYLSDRKKIIPCSVYLNGEYHVTGLYVGTPVVIGKGGVEKIIELKLHDNEITNFEKSVELTRKLVNTAKATLEYENKGESPSKKLLTDSYKNVKVIDDFDLQEHATCFLATLKKYELNIITAESATCGMISSSLAAVPLHGRYIYGGFSTYDSDAKRLFLDVGTADVYTEATAREMALGALTKSRAMTALSITGYAAPAPLDKLGNFDIAFAIRTQPEHTVHSKRVNVCSQKKETAYLCDLYVQEAQISNNKVDMELLTDVRNSLRKLVTIEALDFANSILQSQSVEELNSKTGKVYKNSYDGKYKDFGEPSYIILKHLHSDKELPNDHHEENLFRNMKSWVEQTGDIASIENFVKCYKDQECNENCILHLVGNFNECYSNFAGIHIDL